MDDCFQTDWFLKWCLAHNPNPKRCEPLLKDLSACYAKSMLGN